MIKKETDKHVYKIPDSLSLYEIQKLHFAVLLIYLGEYYQCDGEISPKRVSKKHKYIEYV